MQEFIKVRGAKEHNLKNVDIDIPKNKLVVITGLSGSGKSSLAFDTIYAEGQRRYVESLSAYARQFLQMQNKPDVDHISGLSPAIAIEQKTTSKNPRSTVGTITEIYDYLRLLFARIGVPYSPATGLPIKSQTISEMVDIVLALPKNTKIYILAPIARGQKGEFRKVFLELRKKGFAKIMIDGEIHNIDSIPKIDKNKKHDIEAVVDRLVVENEAATRLASSIETAMPIGEGICYIKVLNPSEEVAKKLQKNDYLILSEKYSCPESGFQIAEIEPRIFSFNSPFGACPKCEGLGKQKFFDPALIVPDPRLSISEGALKPWANFSSKIMNILQSVAKHYNFSLTQPYGDLSKKVQDILLYGSGQETIEFTFEENSRKRKISQAFAGVIPSLEEKYTKIDLPWMKDELDRFKSQKNCDMCDGYRLKKESLCVKIAGLHIGQTTNMTIAESSAWFDSLESKLTEKQRIISERVLKEIKDRLKFLMNVGLEYLNLARQSGTLSGGESQRIRLASQIGSGLSGVLYVLDEPSIGLHQRDNARLIATLKNLRDLGNTVLVVEHDEDTMHAADHIIDVGPGAGVHGGKILVNGNIKDIQNSEESITGKYLSGEKKIEIRDTLREQEVKKIIELEGVTENNLKNVNLSISLGSFVAVTGVSGSGKSSLIVRTLYPAIVKKLEPNSKAIVGKHKSIKGIEYIDKIIDIDQSPIGRTPRSNPATYIGAFTSIRDWFAELPESKARGYKIGRFSFNVKGGRCEACQGDGLVKIEMHFLPDVYVNCEVCNGKRYNRETLEVKYKGKSIADVLEMTVEDAAKFFEKVPAIYDKISTLNEVGLGYIKLGQSATTLSGGEAQRVKLAKELSKRSTGKTFYILDEPTTGLHIDDIKKLLYILHKLVDKGNTVLVIEHNLDVIKTADCIVDVGPEGGDRGGNIIVTGTPEEIVNCKESITGQYLKKYISG